MIVIEVPLHDVIIDVENDIDLAKVSKEEATFYLTQAYHFLPAPLSISIENELVTITSAGETITINKGARLLDRASKEANRGRYRTAQRHSSLHE